jgi:NDP-sugar pyrophosphorylase family protein
VAGRPIIGWNLRWLAAAGVREAWVNLHYRADEVRTALGDGSAFGVRLRFSHEPEILGTAGAWKRLAEAWGTTTLVVYGDSLVRFALQGLIAAHAAAGALATIAVFDPEVHAHTGIAGGRVAVDGAGRVSGFVEAGTGADGGRGLVNAGVYLLDRSLLSRLPAGFADFGRDVFPALARDGSLAAHLIEPDGYCLGLDTPDAFAAAEEIIRMDRIRLA